MKIAAVVVTYNRIGLLQECVDAILAQSRPVDLLMVIDNASTDGTDQLFATNGKYAIPVIDYQRMTENLGGAGGFYEGIKRSFSLGMDWIWIMDDDTIPDEDALSEFCKSLDEIDGDVSFLASSVFGMNREPMNVPGIDTRVSDNGYPDWYRYLNKGIVKIQHATFVSLLINCKAIDAVGYPYKEIFIWGDDKEYTCRLTKYYGSAYMVGDSIVTHKRAIAKSISIENETDPDRIKQFYYNYRNILINVNEYQRGFLSVAKRILGFNALSLKILRDKKQNHRWKKVLTIHKGIWGFIFGSYDRKKFKHRFEKE